MSRIGPSELNRAQAADAVDRKAGKGVNGSTSAGGSDEVTLSTLTERLNSLSAELEATGAGSATREAKLNELTAVVATGDYAPDAEQLSGMLVDEMQAEKP